MGVVFVVWALAVFALIANGIYDIKRIRMSLQWLKQEKEGGQHYTSEEVPHIVILLPVLREQKLISETLQVFSHLKYPQMCLNIVVITTEKEIVQREQARARLASLAKDLAAKHSSSSFLLEKYLGVLPENILRQTLVLAQSKGDEGSIHAFLLEIFNIHPTTMDIVSNDIDRLNAYLGMPLFTHFHYPGTNGDMNQQLEYALQQLPFHGNFADKAKRCIYLAIYNADSRPHADSLLFVANMCKNYFAQYTEMPSAIQQSAVFLENMSTLESNLTGFLLRSAAILQTRFVLSHEIPRLRRQSRSALQFQSGKLPLIQRLWGAEFALCVGHGLFIRYDLAESLKLFSMSTICDDLLWSLRLCFEHIPVLPMPLLESAESPNTLKSLLMQKKSWFLGYIEYLRHGFAALKKKTHDTRTVGLVTFHGIVRAIKWLLLSPVIFIAFSLPLIVHLWQLLLVTIGAYTIYGFFTYWIILTELETLRNKSGGNWDVQSISRYQKTNLMLFSLPAFLIESVGLWLCLLQSIYWIITCRPPSKQKTER